MNTKVKGLLKGLRYISQIFDGKEEQEMQIGHPTDVKHVAHIGWDGPSAVNSPNWMNEFHSAPLSATFGPDGREATLPKSVSQEMPLGGDSPIHDPLESPKPRRSRRHASSSDAPGSDSPNRDSSSRGSRHSRRHQSAGSVSTDSPTRDLAEGSRRGRRHQKSADSVGSESPANDLPSIPKQSRRRKTKGSDGGSTRSSSRSTAPSFSDPGLEERSIRPVPALTPAAEEEI